MSLVVHTCESTKAPGTRGVCMEGGESGVQSLIMTPC